MSHLPAVGAIHLRKARCPGIPVWPCPPFPLPDFVFQFIARHLLYTPEHYRGGKLRNFPPRLSHVCPAALGFDRYHFPPPDTLLMKLSMRSELACFICSVT